MDLFLLLLITKLQQLLPEFLKSLSISYTAEFDTFCPTVNSCGLYMEVSQLASLFATGEAVLPAQSRFFNG